MLDQGGFGFALAAAVRRENPDSIYRDLSLPHARRLASLQAALRDSERDRESVDDSAWTR